MKTILSGRRSDTNKPSFENRGSVLVDAACCLPVFIIAMCMLLSLINLAGQEEKTYYELASAIIDFKPGHTAYITNADIAIDGVHIRSGSCESLAGNTMCVLYTRPFIGESFQNAGIGSARVYVFPKRGERYHKRDCRILDENAIETVLTRRILLVSSPCSICKPSSSIGSAVYMYRNGNVYHKKECPSVTKAYVGMNREMADKDGYTPCLICRPDIDEGAKDNVFE